MRRALWLGMWLWAAQGCDSGSWECRDDEALSSFDGKCAPKESAGGSQGGGSSGSTAGQGEPGANGESGGATSGNSGSSADSDGGPGGGHDPGGNGQPDAGTLPAIDPRIDAHGRACANETDCSPLAPICSMRLGDDCPTAGCCISKGCDESKADSCPMGWKCEFISFAAATYCVPL